jgi:hypothetical protein
LSLSGVDSPLSFLHCYTSDVEGEVYLSGFSISSSSPEVYIWKLNSYLLSLDSVYLHSKSTLPNTNTILHLEPIYRDYQLDNDESTTYPTFLTVDEMNIVKYWTWSNDGEWSCEIQFSISTNVDMAVSRVKSDRSDKMAVGLL